ncbi:extracellular solute-binding protein [Martelella sp. AMO21009]
MKTAAILAAAATFGLMSSAAAFAADGKVIVYTAAPQELVDKMVEGFEAESGMQVELIKAGAGELINRLKAEKGRETSDVLWSVGGEILQANPDLFGDYQPEGSDHIVEAVRPDGKWTPFTVIATSFVINTDELSEDEWPRTWEDLAKPEYKDRVSIARLDKSSSAYIQLATVLQIYGLEKGWDLYSRILDNTMLSNSSGAVPKFVNDGEAWVGVSNEDVGLRFKFGGGPVDVIYPADGTTAQADGMAIMATPANEEGAKAFLDYALSKEGQEIVASIGRRPVRDDVPASDALTPLSDLNLIKYDIDWASEYRPTALQEWNEVIMTK